MIQNVEAEGGELILRSHGGHIAIIPKALGGMVQEYLDTEQHDKITEIVNGLPTEEDYAEDGSLYVGKPPDGGDDRGLNAEAINTTVPIGKLDWQSHSHGLSSYKMNPELDPILGYYGVKPKGSYREGIPNTYPIRAKDLPGLRQKGYKVPPDYAALLEGTGQKELIDYKAPPMNTVDQAEYDMANNAFNNQKAYGGYIKAEEGMVIPKKEAQIEVPKYKTPLESLPEDYTEEFGDKVVDIPKGAFLKDSEATNTISNWNIKGDEWLGQQTEFNSDGKPVNKYEGSPYPGSQGCLGSTCRAQGSFNPNMKSYYDIRDSHLKGLNVRTGKRGVGNNKDFPGLDSWELPTIAEHLGFGNILMKPKKAYDDYKESENFYEDIDAERAKLASNWDNVPIGTIFSTGNADEGNTYTNKGDEVRLEDSKGRVVKELGKPLMRTRHSISSMGLNENGDHIMYDYGKKYTVGNSGKADFTPEDFLSNQGEGKQVMYATALKDQGEWTKAKIERAQKHNRSIEYKNKPSKK